MTWFHKSYMHLYLLYVCLFVWMRDCVWVKVVCVCVCVCVCVADYERPLNVEVVETGMEVFRGKTVFIVRHAQVLEFAHA